jgi:hypothetical protein
MSDFKEKIKDWSNKKQWDYFGGYVKEINQHANYKKKTRQESESLERRKKAERIAEKLGSEGILKHVPGFLGVSRKGG